MFNDVIEKVNNFYDLGENEQQVLLKEINNRGKKDKLEFISEANFLTSDGKYESFGFENKLTYIDSALPVFNAYSANLFIGTNQPELYYDNYSTSLV